MTARRRVLALLPLLVTLSVVSCSEGEEEDQDISNAASLAAASLNAIASSNGESTLKAQTNWCGTTFGPDEVTIDRSGCDNDSNPCLEVSLTGDLSFTCTTVGGTIPLSFGSGSQGSLCFTSSGETATRTFEGTLIVNNTSLDCTLTWVNNVTTGDSISSTGSCEGGTQSFSQNFAASCSQDN